jgi:hypothetical protein
LWSNLFWSTPEIYFNTYDRTSQEAEYNFLYCCGGNKPFTSPSTLEQILDREASRVVRDNLLALRQDR